MSDSIRRGIEQDKQDLAQLGIDMADAVNEAAEDLRIAVANARKPGDGARRGIHRFGEALEKLSE